MLRHVSLLCVSRRADILIESEELPASAYPVLFCFQCYCSGSLRWMVSGVFISSMDARTMWGVVLNSELRDRSLPLLLHIYKMSLNARVESFALLYHESLYNEDRPLTNRLFTIPWALQGHYDEIMNASAKDKYLQQVSRPVLGFPFSSLTPCSTKAR